MKILYSRKETAAALGLSESYVRHAITEGKIKLTVYKVGNKTMHHIDDIQAVVESFRVAA